jgi:CheY-like chemotaxis protein
MDLIMPDMDGLQATRAIRAFDSAQQRDVAIIGLTASSHPQDHAACLEAGMNDVLVKPLNKAHLQTCVEVWLAKKEAAHG